MLFQLQEFQFWVADDAFLKDMAHYREHCIVGRKYNKVYHLN